MDMISPIPSASRVKVVVAVVLAYVVIHTGVAVEAGATVVAMKLAVCAQVYTDV